MFFFLFQNRLIAQLQQDRDDNLNKLQSQLLLFEARLRKGNKEVVETVQEKDRTLKRQHQLILALATALTRRGGQKDLQELIPNLKLDNTSSDTKDNSNDSSENHINEKEKTPSLVITSLKSDLESLNDSDSAIMLEDNFDSLVYIPLGKGEVKVVRSVSDAVECATRGASTGFSCYHRPSSASTNSSQERKSHNGDPSSLSTSPSCSSEEGDFSPASTLNKTKGRRELLRTVYSLDETIISNTQRDVSQITDKLSSVSLSSSTSSGNRSSNLTSILKRSSSTYDSDATLSDGESDSETVTSYEDHSSNDRRLLLGSYEKLNSLTMSIGRTRPEEEIQVTYNRVMSNHRSVTKPKDVKYKRINKAKSRSLEELRGKLRLWDGKQHQSVEGYQAQSYA